jgi:proteasome assembly chaperone (PAC2) family protein
MSLYTLRTPPVMEDPILVTGLAGWGDAASAASDAADWLGEDGRPVVEFDPDAIFDYRSNRPVLRLSSGELRSLSWPRMDIVHVRPGGRDVLVMVGNEPDYAWTAICEALADLVQRLGVVKLVTVGSVPAPVKHALDAAVFCTASDPRLLLPGDQVLMEDIVVPASAGTVFRTAIEDADVPAIGYWAQVPQYVGRPYHPAITALLGRLALQLGIDLDLSDERSAAADQVTRLDAILEQREDAREFIEGLDMSVGTTAPFPDDLPTADEIADEVTRYLRDADNDDDQRA